MNTAAKNTDVTAETMRAVVWDRHGAPEDVLEVREIPRPQAGAGEVVVRVRAASVNPYDWHYYRGDPLMIRVMPGVNIRRDILDFSPMRIVLPRSKRVPGCRPARRSVTWRSCPSSPPGRPPATRSPAMPGST